MNVTSYPGHRPTFGDGARPKVEDMDAGFGLAQEQLLMDVILRPLLGAEDGDAVDGFWGDSFAPSHIGDRVIRLQPGIGLLNGTADDATRARYRPVVLTEVQDSTLPDPASDLNGRVDMICVRPAEEAEEEYRDVKDLESSAGTVVPALITVRKRPSVEVLVVPGGEAPSPSAPAVPSGYVAVAQVTLDPIGSGGAVTVEDLRPSLPRFFEAQKAEAAVLSVMGYSCYGFDGADVRAGSFTVDQDRIFPPTPDVGSYTAELELDKLPHGYTLDNVGVLVNRAEAGGSWLLTVIVRELGESDTFDSFAHAVPADLGERWETIPVDLVVDRSLYSYWLELSVTNPSAGNVHSTKFVKTYCS